MNPFPTFLLAAACATVAAAAPVAEADLLFHVSGDQGPKADYSAAGRPDPTYVADVTTIPDGAQNGALQCGNEQLLAWRAPGNIFAQRGTLSFYWRSRYPVGPTAFPIFRVGYSDHSSWDMVFLRVDYNGGGFDAFVTDASLSRTRVSVPLSPFPAPHVWTHLAVAWDENVGLRLYVNGKLAGSLDRRARYDAGLDQFGPHSRVISPYQVQSDYNFVRGGDLDELRIYDHMLDAEDIAGLSRGARRSPARLHVPARPGPGDDPYGRTLALTAPPHDAWTARYGWNHEAVRAEWYFRYGWNREPPPELPPGHVITVRKVEIHNAYDLRRWWWKANDGIRETTWPGVYNRSRLPGRNDYFQLPDWDCYVESGRVISFALPDEPCNHVEISGAAPGRMDLLAPGADLRRARNATTAAQLFERPAGQERTVHHLATPLRHGLIRFTSFEAEQPIGELGAYYVAAGAEPRGRTTLAYWVGPQPGVPGGADLPPLVSYIIGRHPADEAEMLTAMPYRRGDKPAPWSVPASPRLPIKHIVIPDTWDDLDQALDGIALDIPAIPGAPTHGTLIPLNVQVHDPLWPARVMLDFSFSVRPDSPRTLWLDLRDRLLPRGRPLWITIACASPAFPARFPPGPAVRLVFKPRAEGQAEHVADRFTQMRDAYAMLVEEHPHDPRLDLWNRFKGDLEDLLRVDPHHALGRQYAAVALPGAPRPKFTLPTPPPGVPLWAFRQVKLLERVQAFVDWYIDRRQSTYGDFGGGISDDTDLLNTWPGVALMGCRPEAVKQSVLALLDAAYRNGMFARGLPAIQTDELHCYEEGINTLGQALILAPGSPRLLERAMETARGIELITGINAAGHRHIRSSYFSGTKVATEDPWGYAKPYSYLLLQVPQLLVDYNGQPHTRQYLLELADGLLAHRDPAAKTIGVPSIHFTSDRTAEAGRGYFPAHVFWAAYRFTHDERYLAPFRADPVTALSFTNANLLDQIGLRAEFERRWREGERAASIETKRDATRRSSRTGQLNFRISQGGHFAWQVTGDKTLLEELYAQQWEQCTLLEYINTEGSLWIDRVNVPTVELQRARLGGVALVRNGVFPGHAVSWTFAAPATAQSVGILIPRATPTALQIVAYNLETSAVRATLTGWDVAPGTWEITQGVDTNNDDRADGEVAARSVHFGRSEAIELTLPPRATTVLTLALRTPGTPYWERPDLGLDPEDVSIRDRTLQVRVHGLGSVPSPATTLALRDARGAVLASAAVPAIPAPLDLQPRTVTVSLPLPTNAALAGAQVEIDPDQQLDEITELNNRAPLPGDN
ncbi:LamG-like jellyroll fold domain-containing protein [Opitutus sp. ER46]|uniref:LamG-like jellyroll fold domain-containing protein n=1 Tax=Opitutus sp. ER46 TaxID=2161864 RepID=UPI000D3055D2|nr:LamG-like jellyroll fold domain-containing protein [Opitutus sp. ER46]PTX92510.1 hypothetical protein DB354_14350 [Opitutus sp. ER46]